MRGRLNRWWPYVALLGVAGGAGIANLAAGQSAAGLKVQLLGEPRRYHQAVGNDDPEVVLSECVAELDAAAAQASWQAWFRARARFRHPAAVQVELERLCGGVVLHAADAEGWEELGYRLRPQAVALLADGKAYYRRDQVEESEQAARIWIDYASPVVGEAPSWALDALEAVVKRVGWELVAREGQMPAIRYPERVIYMPACASNLERLNRLGHEVGHLLLGAQHEYWENEAQAQLFVWAHARALGCDLGAYSLPYIFGWSEGREFDRAEVGQALERLAVLEAA